MPDPCPVVLVYKFINVHVFLVSCAQVKCDVGEKCIVKNARATCLCDEICPTFYNPICAADGKTYGNECRLKVARCIAKKHIAVAYEGKCSKYSSHMFSVLPTI